MSGATENERLVTLELSSPIWSEFFTVAPLVVVGTMEPDGTPDLAPKHMVMPLGWQNHVGFMCSETHSTRSNILRTGEFTLSWLRPDSVVTAALAAAPRCDTGEKPSLDLLETFPAETVEPPLVRGGYLYLECRLLETWDALAPASLIAGEIVAARVAESSIRRHDREDADVLMGAPPLAYLSPGWFGTVGEIQAFPFHQGMKR